MPQVARNAAHDDEFERAFPGCAVTHVLTLTSSRELTIVIEALTAVQAAGGGLRSMTLANVSSDYVHRLNIVGLRPGQARRLADRLAASPGVSSASVEHQLLRS